MSATSSQIACLADSLVFQNKVRGLLFQKAIAIVDDYRTEPGVNYSAPQNTRAVSICNGQSISQYYLPLAGSTNVTVSNITFDFDDRQVVSDISDASLASQIYQTVFQDLV